MEWLSRMNQALDYIEENLDGHIVKKELAQIAYCSESHFNRIFAIIADISVGEYIRRRRLTKAAFDIQNTDMKIIDVALMYGYDSPEAFTRAFNKVHGVSPKAARNEGVSLKAYPRITFQITIKGAVAMDYRIETKESFKVYGIEGIFSTEDGGNLHEIPLFWQKAIEDGRLDKLIATGPIEETVGLCDVNAICDYEEMEGPNFKYMLYKRWKPGCNTEGYKVYDVPASTWAIFRTKNHTKEETANAIQDLNRRVYKEWLPTANYEKVDGYELELYYCSNEEGKDYCETWIRVRPK